MNLIVAADENWAIGKNGDLLVHLKEDMKFFRRMTRGHVVVMGRKTLDSFPGGRPLPDRVNLVLSSDPDFAREGAAVVHSVPEALEWLKTRADEEIFIIGGGRIYREFLPYCRRAYVTHIRRAFEGADTWFPELTEDGGWKITETGETVEENGLSYTFTVYER